MSLNTFFAVPCFPNTLAAMAGRSIKRVEWSQKDDIFLCTDIRVREPYKFKKFSNERGKLWTQIASQLNGREDVKLNVTQRGVRERYECLKAKFLDKMKHEEKASGIIPEETELDKLLAEIIQCENMAEASRESDTKAKKTEEDRKTGEAMRKAAMESIGETKKRAIMNNDDGDENIVKPRKRRSGSDAIDFLREKGEKEMKLKEEELSLKKEHQIQEACRQSQMLNQQQEMFGAMKQQQEQMQNIQMMQLQQQQQQTSAMMALLDRLLPKKP